MTVYRITSRAIASLFLSFLLIAPLGAGAQDAGTDEAAMAGAKAAAKRKRPERARVLWWNAPNFVSSLSLTSTQREAMDAIWEQYEAGAPAPGEKNRKETEFQGLLASGSWAEAEALSQRMAQEASDQAAAATGLKIGVLKKLKPVQLKKLSEVNSMVLRSEWTARVHWQTRKVNPALQEKLRK